MFLVVLLFVCLTAEANQGGFFNQQLDHFNASDTQQFNQLYYLNDDYYVVGSPEFLLLAEPGEMHFAYINNVDRPLVKYAKESKARLWMLEHRFFGASQPVNDYSIDILHFLTAEQAIEDARQFIDTNSRFYNIPSGEWLIFGVGYSGMLALRTRQQYPQRTLGAISSSPIMYPQLDFYDYLQHSSLIYLQNSKKCHENIRQGFISFRNYMDNAIGRQQVEQIFQLKPNLSEIQPDDQILQHFHAKLLNNFMIPVENNKVNKPPFNKGLLDVDSICNIMIRPSFFPVFRLVKILSYVQKQLNQTYDPLDIDYKAEVARLRSTKASDERALEWQRCTHLASFPTTDYNQNVWGSLLPLSYYVNRCTDIFGQHFNINVIASSIHKQHKFQFNTTNAIIVNGLVDPLSALSIQKSNTPISIINLASTARAADFWPSCSQDPVELTNARTQILQTIKSWTLKKQSMHHQNRPNLKQSAKDKIVNWNARIFSDPNGGGGNSDLSTNGWYLIEQDLNHFQPNSPKFNQSFAISFNHYKSGGPVFFAFSGETPAMTYTEFTDHTQPGYLAPYFDALLVVLEHRFYGASEATDDLSNKNLDYLNIDQVLADAAVFIHTINEMKGFESPKWITFGCSYGGALSAWFRSEYSDLTFAAFASSPLMFPKVDFYEYTQTVQKVYEQIECADEIRNAFAQIQPLFQTIEGRGQLNSAFVLCENFTEDAIDERDKQTFFYLLMKQFLLAVEKSNHLKTVSSICTTMKDNNLSQLQRLNKMLGFYICLNWSYNGQLAKYGGLKYDYKTYGERQYLWQKCTQLGGFPSTDLGYNLFGSVVPVDYHLQICSDVFGSEFKRDKIEASVEEVRSRYGDRESFKATNLLIISSSNDPWKSMALEPENSSNIKFIVNEDNSHCSDTKPPMIDEDSKKLYKKLRAQLKEWLR